MKVEKISENKVKITLTFEELEIRDISLQDIEKNNSLARDLFIDLLEESNLVDGFATQDSQLFIEATSDNNDLFVVTITRIDNIPELKKYAKLENDKKYISKSNKSNIKVDSNVYLFSNIDKLLDFCLAISKQDAFIGKNTLYKFKNSYFLIFNDSTIKNKNFVKTFSILSEYCDEYYSYDMFKTYVTEKSNIVIENFAVQKLIKKVLN